MGNRGRVGVSSRLRVLIAPAAFAACAVAPIGQAAAPGYEISVGVIESDNIERLPNGGSHDTVFEQELSFIWREQRRVLNADIDADLSHLTYVPRKFSDEVIGNFLGQLRLALAPERLFWNIDDNFGQGVTDPLAAVTPQNRENINYFNTGPQLLLPLGGENLLEAKANYGKSTYQHSRLDSNRYSGGLGFIHRLSEVVETSLNVSDERVNYSDDQRNPDYSSQEAFVHLGAKGARTTLGVDVGYGRVVIPNSSPGIATARLDLSRKISGSSAVSFSFGREYADAVAAFQMSQVLSGANLNTQQTVQTGGPSTMVYETAGWNFTRNRTSLALSVSHFKDDYLQNPALNDSRTELDGNVARQLTPTVRVALLGQYFRQTFANSGGTSNQLLADARLSWQASRRITLTFDYNYGKRTSDIAGTGYTENRVLVSIGYGRPVQAPPGVVAPPLAHPTTY